MKYTNYIQEVMSLCIIDSEEAWTSILRPDYKKILYDNDMLPIRVSDYDLSMDELSELLKLEVERRRAWTDRTAVVMNALYNAGKQYIQEGDENLMRSFIQDMATSLAAQKDGAKPIIPSNVSYAKKS